MAHCVRACGTVSLLTPAQAHCDQQSLGCLCRVSGSLDATVAAIKVGQALSSLVAEREAKAAENASMTSMLQ